jgi:hypothetical protein
VSGAFYLRTPGVDRPGLEVRLDRAVGVLYIGTTMIGRLLRRIHMYLALALTPWVVVYAVSTVAMNHREWFSSTGTPQAWTLERETVFHGVLPGEDHKAAALVLLASLDLDGAHSVSRRAKDSAIVIQRQDPVVPRRITYTPADNRLVVEALPYRSNQFLERVHRRRGYQQPYRADDIWAFSVDFVIVALLFWVFSGLWLWWELKNARAWGALSLAAGVTVFAFYLVVL